MIDFQNASYLKLKAAAPHSYEKMIAPMLVNEEQIIAAFQSVRDGIVFTNKRIIAINVQGLTGKKRDLTSLPYSKIQSFSIETAGVMDLDSELILWFSGMGMIKFEFTGGSDVLGIARMISSFVLG